ncbi:MAG TPA: alcohol dehydrogenase catalytic domain-containing protein, partial [Roseiflexaceae bacterium]|nr:alcohol dehydrogenase catalytic domain-containing protein [Roseiflexaceae bacterium]
MKTIVLEEPGRFALHDTVAPQAPSAGEALVRVHRVGICGTDLHAFAGRQPFFSYPRILGHELGVEILALDPASPTALVVGDRCCIQPYLHCGRCTACRRGATNCCVRLQTLGVHTDGGMRELITIPIHLLHRSASLSYEQLAMVEMLCIGAHAVRRAAIAAGERALVIGVGPIGLGAAVFARAAGAHVLVMDVSEQRLAFAAAQGFAEQIDGREDVPAQLQALCGDDPPTVVFDATGHAQSMMRAFSYPANAGRLVFVGLFQGDVTFNDPEFH